MITDINLLDLEGKYSYADYLTWEFEERVEILKGKVFSMGATPNTSHQRISGKLSGILWQKFNNMSLNFFAAPFDVRLLDKKKSTLDQEIYTVVQPDLCVICDRSKIDKKGCIGAPDLIIEILSPGNSKKEMDIKYDLYEENGVLEYWMVNPSEKTISIFVLQNGKYIGIKPLIEDSKLKSPTFPDLTFAVKKVFKV